MADVKYQNNDPLICFSLTDFHININEVKIRPNENIEHDLYTKDDSMGYLMAHEIIAAGSRPAIQRPALAPGL